MTPRCHDFGPLPGPSRLCEAPLRDSNTIDTGSCVELFSVVDGLCQVEQQRSSTAAMNHYLRIPDHLRGHSGVSDASSHWHRGGIIGVPLASCTANRQHRDVFV